MWEGQPIPLELHHMDGDNTNNALPNLQILCPNCHAMTTYYRGSNKKRKAKTVITDSDFITIISNSYSRRQALLTAKLTAYGGNYIRINDLINTGAAKLLPSRLNPKICKKIEDIKNKHDALAAKKPYKNPTKIVWPSKQELETLLRTKSAVQISNLLGISDTSIRKKARTYGLSIQDLSPWAQKHNPNK